MTADELSPRVISSALHPSSPGPPTLPTVPSPVVTAAAPNLLLLFPFLNSGSRLSASVGAAAASPSGAAPAQEPPGASAPGWDAGTAPALGGHPGFRCDSAHWGLTGVWDANPRGLSACELRQCRGLGWAVPWAALCPEELGSAAPCNAPAEGKPGTGGGSGFSPCEGRQWRCLSVPTGDVLAAISPHLGDLSPSGEQISTPKGLSSQIIPSAHANSTQTRNVWHKVPIPRNGDNHPEPCLTPTRRIKFLVCQELLQLH